MKRSLRQIYDFRNEFQTYLLILCSEILFIRYTYIIIYLLNRLQFVDFEMLFTLRLVKVLF